MINESEYCGIILVRNFNKPLVLTKINYKEYKNYTKCWVSENIRILMLK